MFIELKELREQAMYGRGFRQRTSSAKALRQKHTLAFLKITRSQCDEKEMS